MSNQSSTNRPVCHWQTLTLSLTANDSTVITSVIVSDWLATNSLTDRVSELGECVTWVTHYSLSVTRVSSMSHPQSHWMWVWLSRHSLTDSHSVFVLVECARCSSDHDHLILMFMLIVVFWFGAKNNKTKVKVKPNQLTSAIRSNDSSYICSWHTIWIDRIISKGTIWLKSWYWVIAAMRLRHQSSPTTAIECTRRWRVEYLLANQLLENESLLRKRRYGKATLIFTKAWQPGPSACGGVGEVHISMVK